MDFSQGAKLGMENSEQEAYTNEEFLPKPTKVQGRTEKQYDPRKNWKENGKLLGKGEDDAGWEGRKRERDREVICHLVCPPDKQLHQVKLISLQPSCANRTGPI